MKPALALCALAASGAVAAADALDDRLAGPGDAARGRQIFATREGGHCVICHAADGIAPAGNVGPALDGIGRRLSEAQLRLRIVDITRVKPEAAMPAFHRHEELSRVAAAYVGKPLLDGQQVEDLVAFLAALR